MKLELVFNFIHSLKARQVSNPKDTHTQSSTSQKTITSTSIPQTMIESPSSTRKDHSAPRQKESAAVRGKSIEKLLLLLAEDKVCRRNHPAESYGEPGRAAAAVAAARQSRRENGPTARRARPLSSRTRWQRNSGETSARAARYRQGT